MRIASPGGRNELRPYIIVFYYPTISLNCIIGGAPTNCAPTSYDKAKHAFILQQTLVFSCLEDRRARIVEELVEEKHCVVRVEPG